MQTREYIENDFSTIKTLLKENLKYHADIDTLGLRKYKEGDEGEDISSFTEKMGNGEGYCLVAENENEIIGFGYAYLKSSEDGLSKKGHISKIFIMEEFRGKGLGSEILKKLEEYLIKKGCKSISLSVYGPNVSTHNLYLAKGYKDRFIEMIKAF